MIKRPLVGQHMVAFRDDIGEDGAPGKFHVPQRIFETLALAKRYAETVSPAREPVILKVVG